MANGSVNKVILIGNLGRDPEIRYLPSGGAVANLAVATSEKWRDKQTGDNREKTEWHRVVLFGKLVSPVAICAKALKFISRDNYKPANGMITVLNAIQLKLL